MRKTTRITHRFFCTNCGREGLPLARKVSHQHEKGHLKNLYCPWCKAEYNHWECHDDEEVARFKEFYRQEVIQHELSDYVLRDSRQRKINGGSPHGGVACRKGSCG